MQTNKTKIFEQYRQTLEGLAYRMLGTLSEAQDAVQETYFKWHHQNASEVNNYRAWLITVCSRICLNQLKIAYRQRELYVGEWLPEPLFQDITEDENGRHEIKETLTMALLLVLEKLNPIERTVFILHDVFEIKFNEIADIVGKTSGNCRKIATRARQYVQDNQPRFTATPEQHKRLLDTFVAAAQACDVKGLIEVLAVDAELYSDGGGIVEALPEVLSGSTKIASFFSTIFSDYQTNNTNLKIVSQRLNASVGLLIYENKQLTTAIIMACTNHRILRIFAVRNPNKLQKSKQACALYAES